MIMCQDLDKDSSATQVESIVVFIFFFKKKRERGRLGRTMESCQGWKAGRFTRQQELVEGRRQTRQPDSKPSCQGVNWTSGVSSEWPRSKLGRQGLVSVHL